MNCDHNVSLVLSNIMEGFSKHFLVKFHYETPGVFTMTGGAGVRLLEVVELISLPQEHSTYRVAFNINVEVDVAQRHAPAGQWIVIDTVEDGNPETDMESVASWEAIDFDSIGSCDTCYGSL